MIKVSLDKILAIDKILYKSFTNCTDLGVNYSDFLMKKYQIKYKPISGEYLFDSEEEYHQFLLRFS